MTPQEQQALQGLLSQLVQVRNIPKDAQAEGMIAEAVSRQPDAAYLLVQRCMLLEQGLEAAKAQIAELQQQVQQGSHASSFLDANAWGHHPDPSRADNRQMDTSVSGAPLPQARQYTAPAYQGPQAQAGYARPGVSSWLGGQGGSMLGTMAATAAGVAGGAFLFQGLSHLLGGHHDQAANAAGLAGTGDAQSSMFSSSALSELGPDKFGLDSQSGQQSQDGTLADDLFASDTGSDADLFGGDDNAGGDLFAADDSSDSDTYDT